MFIRRECESFYDKKRERNVACCSASDRNRGMRRAEGRHPEKKGYTIEASPNAKITEEQYAVLVKEFN